MTSSTKTARTVAAYRSNIYQEVTDQIIALLEQGMVFGLRTSG